MRATIREVAREADVSPSTVSRALSAPEMVNPTTRERVLRVAQRLGYAPNRAARGLITGRTWNLGLIVLDLANPFFPSVAKGVRPQRESWTTPPSSPTRMRTRRPRPSMMLVLLVISLRCVDPTQLLARVKERPDS